MSLVLLVPIPPHNLNLDLQLVLDLVDLLPLLELLEPQQPLPLLQLLQLKQPQEQLELKQHKELLELKHPLELLEPKQPKELLEPNQLLELLESKQPLELPELPLLEVVLHLCLLLDLRLLAPTKHVVMHCRDPTKTLVWDIWLTIQVPVPMEV